MSGEKRTPSEAEFMDPQTFDAQIKSAVQQEKEKHPNTESAVEDKSSSKRSQSPPHQDPTMRSWDGGVSEKKRTPSEAEFMDPQTFQSQMQMTLKQEYGDEFRGTRPAFEDALPPSFQKWPVSEQIYVMGSDIVGRYIAFKLASVQTLPPVRYLIHRMNLWKTWEEHGRQLTLHTSKGTATNNRVQAEYMSMKADTPIDGPHIENIIVTVPPGTVVSALAPIKHRLDHRSTICLIHDGLGAAEAIIEAHFPDKFTRPVFVLGHLSTKLAHPRTNDRFGVVELKPGRLYLSLFGTMPTVPNMRVHIQPPMERTTRFKHFLRLMVTMPGFYATSHPFPDFLRIKLPRIILLSIADPLASMLGVPYVQLGKNRYSKRLVLEMLWEVCNVVAKLPENRNKRGIQWIEQRNTLQRDFFLALNYKVPAATGRQISLGWATDIHYLTGYFISRAKELGVPTPTLSSIFRMLMAKREFDGERSSLAIPFEGEQESDGDLGVPRIHRADGAANGSSRFFEEHEANAGDEGHDREDQAY